MISAAVVHRGDARLSYRVEGSGPPLVLLHGGLVDGRSWERQAVLGTTLTLVLPDTRGFGASTGPVAGLELDTLVDDVLAVTDDARLDRFSLLGFSMGGVVAAAFARRYPERLRALMLVASPAGGYSPSSLLGDDVVRAHVERAFSAPFRAGNTAFLDEYIEMARSNEAATGVVRAALAGGPTLGELGTIERPTLVVHGSGDLAIPVTHAERVARTIPKARLHLLEGAGHSVHLERPDAFNSLIADFVDRPH